jgi:hypothetical protein
MMLSRRRTVRRVAPLCPPQEEDFHRPGEYEYVDLRRKKPPPPDEPPASGDADGGDSKEDPSAAASSSLASVPPRRVVMNEMGERGEFEDQGDVPRVIGPPELPVWDAASVK